MKIHSETLRKAYLGAQHYAQAEKSDPFALARARAHIKQGVAFGPEGEGLYSAEPTTELRKTPIGETYEVNVFRAVKRP